MESAYDKHARVWLYSGFFTGWWCYDEVNNKKLNIIYNDYCTRNNIITNYNEQSLPLKTGNLKPEAFDTIDFNMIAHCTDNFNIGDTNMDYTVSTDHGDLKIDFENMKQIDMTNFQKQRSINFIYVPIDMYDDIDTYIKYLKQRGVIGILGKKFD